MATLYAVLVTGNNLWSATSTWSTTPDGLGVPHAAPTSTDDVAISSICQAGATLTVDATAYCKDMDWTGALYNPTMSIGALHIVAYGNVTFIEDMTINATSWGWYIDLMGNTTQELTCAGVTGNKLIVQFNTASNLSLQDDLVCGLVDFARGSITTNNHNILAVSANADWGIQIKGTTAKTMNLGSSTITTSEWDYEASGLTLNEGTSTINCSGAFNGNGETYNIVNLTGATSTISGSNTYAELNLDDTKTQTITFTDGTTQTITGTLSLSGSVGHVHTLKGSSTGGWALSRNYGGGFWGDYLAISNSNVSATDGSTKRWNYGPNSTASSSTGWTSRTADDMAIFNSNLKDKDLFTITSVTRSIQTVLLDALIKATDSKTVSIDTLIKGVDITSTITIDTLIKDTDLKTVLLDTLIKGQSASTVSLDTQIRDTDSTSVSLDTLIKDTALQTISISVLVGNRIDFIPTATNSSSQTHKATNSSSQTNKATNSEF